MAVLWATLRPLLPYLIAAAVGAYFAGRIVGSVQQKRINSRDDTIKEQTSKIAKVEGERDNWRTASADCTTATREWGKRMEAAEERAAKATAAARAEREARRKEREHLEAMIAAPTPPGAGCDQAWDEIERGWQ